MAAPEIERRRGMITKILINFPLPNPNLSRLIWQPVTENLRGPNRNTAMRLQPLSWQPSGAHHALEYLASEVDRLNALLKSERNGK